MDETQPQGPGADIFDKETTVSKNSGDIERLLIMQQRERVMRDIANYHKTPQGSTQKQRKQTVAKTEMELLMGRIGHLIQSSNETTYNEITNEIEKGNLYEAMKKINIYLTKIGLTDFRRKKIDTTNVENENREKQL